MDLYCKTLKADLPQCSDEMNDSLAPLGRLMNKLIMQSLMQSTRKVNFLPIEMDKNR